LGRGARSLKNDKVVRQKTRESKEKANVNLLAEGRWNGGKKRLKSGRQDCGGILDRVDVEVTRLSVATRGSLGWDFEKSKKEGV